MANILRFVDDISASPSTSLDLNTGEWKLLAEPGPDFSPPKMRRSVVGSLLQDGQPIVASAYENREIRLTLELTPTNLDEDFAAVEFQNLAVELDKELNVLMWQPETLAQPVFFRTLRSPDYTIEEIAGHRHTYRVRLNIIAEPFGYGAKQTLSAFTLDNDPAGATNPMYFTCLGTDMLDGDLPTPAFITIDPVSSLSSVLLTCLSVRQHGTPGGITPIQAESMTQGTNTTVQTNDTVMSGAGSNYSRCTFGTATMQTRLNAYVPAASDSVEFRGTYRIFGRFRRSDGTSVIRVQAAMGDSQEADIVTLPLTTNRIWIDLGLLSLPADSDDPMYEGFSLTKQSVSGGNLQIKAARDSGTGNLDFDAFMMIPADEGLGMFKHLTSTALELILDGPIDAAYSRYNLGNHGLGSGTGLTNQFVERVGSIPYLVPNQNNRIAFIPNVYHSSAPNDDKTWTFTVTVAFWPRHLYIAT